MCGSHAGEWRGGGRQTCLGRLNGSRTLGSIDRKVSDGSICPFPQQVNLENPALSCINQPIHHPLCEFSAVCEVVMPQHQDTSRMPCQNEQLPSLSKICQRASLVPRKSHKELGPTMCEIQQEVCVGPALIDGSAQQSTVQVAKMREPDERMHCLKCCRDQCLGYLGRRFAHVSREDLHPGPSLGFCSTFPGNLPICSAWHMPRQQRWLVGCLNFPFDALKPFCEVFNAHLWVHLLLQAVLT